MKRTMWLFIDKKTHLLVVMDYWSWKIWISHLIGTSQNENFYINSHSKFVIGIQCMIKYKMINSYHESFFENLNHLIVRDFWMVQIWPYFHRSIWVAIFVLFFKFFAPIFIYLKALDGPLFIWTLWVFLLGLPGLKITSNTLNINFSHKFEKVCRWLSMYYSKIIIITF